MKKDASNFGELIKLGLLSHFFFAAFYITSCTKLWPKKEDGTTVAEHHEKLECETGDGTYFEMCAVIRK